MIRRKYNQALGLIKWSLLRHKFYIPVFIVVQFILSLAIVYGFAFLTKAEDPVSKSYLATGSITMNLIAATCVLSPQIVSEAKQNGVFDYQKTLPISRLGILLADLLIWAALALPGIFFSLILGTGAFDLSIKISLLGLMSLIFVIVSLTLLGFSIAYLLPPNLMTMATQLIMLGGLLFSPIIYSADSLPAWTAYLYNTLPFVPVSQIIRSSLFGLEQMNPISYLTVLLWGLIAYTVSMAVLKRRQ